MVDFTPGGTEDAIEIGYSSIDTFSELLDATSNTNDGCVISIDETTTVHLLGVSKGQLTAADFYVPLYNDIQWYRIYIGSRSPERLWRPGSPGHFGVRNNKRELCRSGDHRR